MDGLSEKLVVALICMIGFFTANSLTAPVALLLVYFCLSAAVILIPQKYSAVSAGLIAAGAAAGLLFPLALCFLDGIRPVIQRQKQEVEAETQRNDSSAGIPVDNMKGYAVNDFEEQFQRAKKKLIDCLQNGHLCFSPIM